MRNTGTREASEYELVRGLNGNGPNDIDSEPEVHPGIVEAIERKGGKNFQMQ
ncbi:MAG: hypothetical protein U0T33_11915 [Bacteroidales bacterium]